ncbi:MAG: hypothetical protein PHH12_02610 [Candidatus Shapirobacteria bacterium]|jgi:hypothetical protein|nr:hypothetical protein [Candidatus Shapirobacteria bacterium]
MNQQKTKVIIKNHDGQILNKDKTIKVIDEIRSTINPESRENFLKYKTEGENVLIKKDDLIILKVKLPKIGHNLV